MEKIVTAGRKRECTSEMHEGDFYRVMLSERGRQMINMVHPGKGKGVKEKNLRSYKAKRKKGILRTQNHTYPKAWLIKEVLSATLMEKVFLK